MSPFSIRCLTVEADYKSTIAVNFHGFENGKILFTFDGMVNAADKYPRDVKTYCTQHQEECVAQASIITKEEE